MEYPANQIEFENTFNTERKCLDFILSIRWPDGFVCPECNCEEYWQTKRLYKCKSCKHQASPTSGTIFHKSKKPLTLWFRVFWWMIAQKNGVSASGISRILGFGSYKTAWAWLHKIRRLMVIPGREKLCGHVEVDETYIGGKKSGKRGRGAEGKKLAAIAVEIKKFGLGRTRIEIIPNASGKSLKAFMVRNIVSGSTVLTDEWRGYRNASKWGFKHEVVAARVIYDESILPNVHRIAALLKRWLLGTHQNYVSNEKLGYYLDEFTFRHNRRNSKSRGLLFYRLIEQAVVHSSVSFRSIVSNKL